jgi:cytochrome oxidase Cu insertion factor (SCO1/SenC/PrrC family)
VIRGARTLAPLLALGLALAAAASLASAGPLYQAPVAGSYELPPIARVTVHPLVDADGAAVSFPALAKGQVALVAFIYRGCHEAQGCPASLALLRDLDRKLAADPARASRVRLASVSFDPANDTPERMRELREMMAPKSDWTFLSAADQAALAPLLSDYGQDATPLEDGSFRHVLKIFLLDDQLRVRNVYSAGLLDPRLVLADIDTVAAEKP